MNILFVNYGDATTNSLEHINGFARALRQLGHDCVIALTTLPFGWKKAEKFIDYSQMPRLQEFFTDGRWADIIHAWTPRENVRRVVIKSLQDHYTPFVVHLEDNERHITEQFTGRQLEELRKLSDRELSTVMSNGHTHPWRGSHFLEISNGVTVITPSLQELAPASHPSQVICPGVSSELFHPQPPDLGWRSKLRPGEKMIYYAGGINVVNAPDFLTLYEGVVELNKRGFSCQLWQTGPSTLTDAASRPYLKYLGLVEQTEVVKLLASADVLVQPGKIDVFNKYRLPSKIPQFLAMGRPTVVPATNIGLELVDDEETLLLKTGTATEIADQCQRIFENPELAKRIATGGAAWARQHCNWVNNAGVLLKFYEKILAAPPAEHLRAIQGTNRSERTALAIKIREGLAATGDKADVDHLAALIDHLEKDQQTDDLAVTNNKPGLFDKGYRLAYWLRQKLRHSERLLGKTPLVSKLVAKRLSLYLRHPRQSLGATRDLLNLVAECGAKGAARYLGLISQVEEFYRQQRAANPVTASTVQLWQKQAAELTYRPLFSIIMPVYNTEEGLLRAAIKSVLAQAYPDWELCIADDASPDPKVKAVLDAYAQLDSRIKVVYREENGHISAASNSALELATGEFVANLDHDDLLAPNALLAVAKYLQSHKDTDVIYSDEDKITAQGEHHAPTFKPSWSPDHFLGQMYLAHFLVYRRSLLAKSGGYRVGFEGAQDWDFVLRLTETTHKIGFIPEILYSWRVSNQSTALSPQAKNYAHEAGSKAVQEALVRRWRKGTATGTTRHPGHFAVHYQLIGNPLISIIIGPGQSETDRERISEMIRRNSDYANFEVIIPDKGETAMAPGQWKNKAVVSAKGEMILFLGKNMARFTPKNWLQEMAAYAQNEHVGAVGGVILAEDGSIDEAGLAVSSGMHNVYSHRGQAANSPGYLGRLLVATNPEAVSDRCLLVRKDRFLAVGGFAETGDLGIGLCQKLREKGYFTALLPWVQVG